MKKVFIVRLAETERSELEALVCKGKAAALSLARAQILLKADQGKDGEAATDAEIAKALSVAAKTVFNVRRRWVEDGLEAALWRMEDVLEARLAQLASAPGSSGEDVCHPDQINEVAPQARADLIAAGHSKESVDAMSPAQAVVFDMLEIYEAARDQLFKWFNVPYPQAQEGISQAESHITQMSKRKELTVMADMLLPAVGRAYLAEIRPQRRLAALRCVEAISLYAAAHDGRLPPNLDDIREVPLPIDELTGKPFQYRLEGDVAVLVAT